MYTASDERREKEISLASGFEPEEYRSPWRRDYARLIHSPSFRRLQGKTQLYPGLESDFFRNRLTHSLEVAQIAKGIAVRINNRFTDNKGNLIKIEADICEFAGLAHDLGHPPFGHQGEEALDECMRDYGGFEGNAQTLRILSKIEKKVKEDSTKVNNEFRYGLNLTYRSLASILKYDKSIPIKKSHRLKQDQEKPIKGYYKSEADLVKKIKKHVAGNESLSGFKTVECKIMDIADDIAYSTYDLEDGLKANFYTPIDILFANDHLFKRVAEKVTKAFKEEFKKVIIFTEQDVKDTLYNIFKTIFSETTLDLPPDNFDKLNEDSLKALLTGLTNIYYKQSMNLASDGYARADFTSKLVGEFVRGVAFKYDKKNPSLSHAYLNEETRIKVEVLKNYTFESQILSPRLKVAEYRGKEIVHSIFKVLSENNGWRLMPTDYRALFEHFRFKADKMRVICDFISGMTDRYAIEFYGRLKSENPETIFKPF